MQATRLIVTALLVGAVGIASAESPVNYPDQEPDRATQATPGKSRAEVKAELAEARRLGLIAYGEVNDKVATPEQEQLIAEAGHRAVAELMAKR
jgi:thiamine pyrophosphate-dependent acetolactate synthase large subunit-like protein